MDKNKRVLRILAMVGVAFLIPSCSLPVSPSIAPVITETPTSTAQVITETPFFTLTPTPAPTLTSTVPSPITPPEHLIGVRVVDGAGEFYLRSTGERFIPRGNNYIRLGSQRIPGGGTQVFHSVFDPGTYEPLRVATDFERMHADGYNVVRVFLSQNTIGSATGGLSPEYLENISDLLKHAKANQLHVMITLDWLPGGKYGDILNRDCCELFNFMNIHFLAPAGLEANQLFFQDLIQELTAIGAPTEAIFAYELRNELFFDTNYPPLALTSGTIQAANGQIYDLSNPEEKVRLVDENLVYWIDNMRAAILEFDPTALVTVGFFHPQEPNPARIGDLRLVSTFPAIWQSQADFIDLHPYPGAELNLNQYAENFGMEGMEIKPIIMGEYGASTQSYPSLDAAAKALLAWQIESCELGFDGWLLWTWDLNDGQFFKAVDGDGVIEKVLAPVNRPDPCQSKTFDFLENNIALGKNVRVSRFLPHERPENAVDGSDALWGAGADPPQWVEIDLGEPSTIQTIRLKIAQYPEGNTVHQVWAGGPDHELTLVHEFSGVTRDSEVLAYISDPPLIGIQYVRVLTIVSPSWVAWKEIEVISK